jgi:DtxR family Mn-dependent transcriptional regulator
MGEALSASLEDYLEAIFHIVSEKQAAKAKDIAKWLTVKSSSVTGALQALARKNLVNYAPYDVITLTPKGRIAAQDIVRRHQVLSDFMVNVLAVDGPEAEKAACRMEHAITRPVLDRLIKFVEFLDVCPRAGTKWIHGFSHYCEDSQAQEGCEDCITLCLKDYRSRKKRREGSDMTTTLNELKPGQKGKILKIKGRGELKKRFLDMGATPGALVEVERIAPLGDPIDIKLKGYHLSLRKEEAARITIERLSSE